MASAAVETYHPTPEPVTSENCSLCGKKTTSQAYVLVLERPNITREWVFCKLSHLRTYMSPDYGGKR